MANWFERFAYAAGSFGKRIAENAGVFDVVEEFSKYDDGDMTATDWLRTIGGATRQLADVPFTGLASWANEANRAAGTGVRMARDNPLHFVNPVLGLGYEALGSGDAYHPEVIQDYFTGGFTNPGDRERYAAERGLTANQAAGAYTPVTLSDAAIVGVDKAVNRWGNWALAIPLAGQAYAVGSFFNDQEGVQSNGSYLPRSFDLWSQDAGLQLWERSDLRHQLIAGQLVTEMAIDPLNWAAGPIAASISGMRSAKLVLPTQRVDEAGNIINTMPTGAQVAAHLDLISNTAVENHRWLRMRQWVPGRGTWNPHRMLTEMANNPNQRQMLERLATETNRSVLRDWLVSRRMADGTGADSLAGMLSVLNDPGDVAALFYAAAYRDKTAMDRVLNKLDSGIGTFPMANELRTQAGLAANALEAAPYQFGAGNLPDGHLLKMTAQEFVDDAIERQWAATGPAPGVANPIRAQWDALAENTRTAYVTQLGQYQQGMQTAQRVFRNAETSAYFPLERMTSTRGGVAQRALNQAARPGDQRMSVMWAEGVRDVALLPTTAIGRAVELFTGYKVPTLKINGRSIRTSPTVWLLAKPGLAFELHGMDAVSHFDGLIQYGDGIIGPRAVDNKGNPLTRLIHDPEVASLRDRFVGAGGITRAPEQVRAGLVNDLQKLIIARMAAARGVDPDAAQIIADLGMKKAEGVANGLNKMDTGYTTVAIEDNIPLILANHPTAIRQTANFIPIMDLKALDDAMKSKGLQRLVNPDHLLSITDVTTALERVGTKGNQIQRVGRGPVARATHTLIDTADIVNTWFKMEVLIRLGYPVRNGLEAHLSAYASGVGWLNVLSAAKLPTLMGNFMTNARYTPQRMTDRVQTARGVRANEETMLSTAQGLSEADVIVSNGILNLIRLASDPDVMAGLVRRAQAGEPEAIQDLNYLLELRLRGTQPLDPDHELVRDGIVAFDAAQSGTFFHADTTGALAGGTDNLTGPIATVPDSMVAQNRVDTAWGASPDWRTIDVSPGVVRGGWRIPGAVFGARNQRPELINLFNAQVAAGVRPRWRVNQNGTVSFNSAAGRDEFVAALQNPAAIPGANATVLNNIATKVEAAARWHVRQKELAQAAKTSHVQYRVNQHSAWVDWTGPLPYKGGRNHNTYEFRTIAKPASGAQPGLVQMDAWGPEINLTDPVVGAAVLDRYPDLDPKIVSDAVNGDRVAQRRISEVFAKEGFYRVRLPDAAEWNGVNVLIHPKGVGEEGFQRLLAKNVAEVVKAEVRPGVSVPLLEGMSKGARREANKGGVKLTMPADTFPTHVVQPGENIAGVLRNGGFEALLEEMTQAAANLRSQRATVAMAYNDRMAKVGKMAKRKGIPESVWKMQSIYGGYYRTLDHLHGPNGPAYAQVTAGNLTQAQSFGMSAQQGDLISDMARALVHPEELHPGDPRFFEGLANLLSRQYRDMPGAITPDGVTRRDIDPVFARALKRGDREKLLNDTIDWVINTHKGQEWLHSLNLKSAKDVPTALAAAERAQARRGAIPPLTDTDYRRTVKQNWQDNLNEEVGVDVADVVRATFAFADSHLPTQRVRDLFTSGQLDANTLRAAYDEEPWDLYAFNGLVSPTHPAFRQAMRQRRQNQEGLNKVADGMTQFLGKALEKLGSGPETRLARHPIYNAIGKADLQQRVTFAEQALGRELNLDEFLQLRELSQKFAVKKMEQTIYTLKSRSSVDDMLRFLVPFFPAWRNAATRWGRFAMENPAGVAKVVRLYDSTLGQLPWYDSATGAEVDPESADPNESYMLMPGMGSWIPGWKDDPAMRESMRRTKMTRRSFDVIFQGEPFNPGFGPWVGVPVQAILERNAKLYDSPMGREVAKWFLPIGPQQTGTTGFDGIAAFLPSSVRPIFNAMIKANSQQSMEIRIGSVYMANGNHLNEDGSYKSDEQIDAEIHNAVLKYMGVKTLSYLISPVSAQPVGDQEFYAGQMRALREAHPTEDVAEQTFLERFGPERWWYVGTSTSNLTGGMATGRVVANQKAMAELAYEATTTYDDPRLLGFFENLGPNGETMPYDADEYNPYARNWQMKHNPGASPEPYRGGKDFNTYADDTRTQLGWRYYDYNMGVVDLKLQQEGYMPGSPEFVAERARRSTAVAGVVAQWVPEWGQSRQVIDTAKTERAADFFNWAVNDTEWVKQGDRANWAVIDGMRRYLADRETVRAEIGRRKALNPDAGSTSDAKSNSDLTAWLQTRREMYAQGSASFEDWANRFFRNDGISFKPILGPPVEAITR